MKTNFTTLKRYITVIVNKSQVCSWKLPSSQGQDVSITNSWFLGHPLNDQKKKKNQITLVLANIMQNSMLIKVFRSQWQRRLQDHSTYHYGATIHIKQSLGLPKGVIMVHHDQRIVVLYLITFLPGSRCLQVSKSKTLFLTVNLYCSSNQLYSNGTLI